MIISVSLEDGFMMISWPQEVKIGALAMCMPVSMIVKMGEWSRLIGEENMQNGIGGKAWKNAILVTRLE